MPSPKLLPHPKKLSFPLFTMARTKCTARRVSTSGKRAKSAGGTPQGGIIGAGATESSSPSQQLSLGHGPAGSRAEEGLRGEGRCRPSRACCSPGEGGPAACLPLGQLPEVSLCL
ncbi:hypothetical protein LIER_25612 [Lithospermum erythrorhizon]|uniref:Uncharacterized protein n=1 Tax=Lithospermum erythrorhizon TaxID=34254 RepID=A0AAV3R7I1_LITER